MSSPIASTSTTPLPFFESVPPFSIIDNALQEVGVPPTSERIYITCSASEHGPLFVIDNTFTAPPHFATVNSATAWCHYTFLRIVDSLEISTQDEAGNVFTATNSTNEEKIRRMQRIVYTLTSLKEHQAVQMLISSLSALRVWPQSVCISATTRRRAQPPVVPKASEPLPVDPTPLAYSSDLYESPDLSSPPNSQGMLANLEASIKKNQAALQVAKSGLLQVTKARFCTPYHVFASRWTRLRREIRIRETRHLELRWQKGLLLGQQEELHTFMKSNNTIVPKGIASLMRDVCREQAAQW